MHGIHLLPASVPLCVALFATGCQPSTREVSYSTDVAPILEKHCKACHMPGQAGYVVSGFELQNYETLMKGTQYGPVVLPGDPLTSVLVMLIEGRADPSLKMPHGDAEPLDRADIATIRQWVEQGAKNN
ncbi:MAG: hypothetical protein K0R70_1068 [Steroidobacteraceae bacterium]|jgi:hypothetical protein|nr:hypothetical protein [Steroidobacteraceae bacterium]